LIATQASKADLVIVSTDDFEMAQTAKNLGVTVHKRSDFAASDSASTEFVLDEVLLDLGADWPEDTIFGFVQVTSPFLSTESINTCLDLAKQGFVGFTASVSNLFCWEQSESGWQAVNHPGDFRPRRQDRRHQVFETGGCYVFPLAAYRKLNFRFCAEARPVIVDTFEGIDIDSEHDLLVANSIEAVRAVGVRRRFQMPKALVTDFDGCLTDDRVFVDENGVETVAANRKDGLAAKKITDLGIKVLILSSEKNPVVAKRAQKMNLPFIQASANKLGSLKSWIMDLEIELKDVWYLGNDLNDLEVMGAVGVALCPLDAVPVIQSVSQIVLETKGGHGILSEVLTILEDSRDK
jgi:N-acylneuraminate cytidylyltransferase